MTSSCIVLDIFICTTRICTYVYYTYVWRKTEQTLYVSDGYKLQFRLHEDLFSLPTQSLVSHPRENSNLLFLVQLFIICIPSEV